MENIAIVVLGALSIIFLVLFLKYRGLYRLQKLTSSELVMMRIDYDGNYSDEIIRKDHVNRMLAAQLKLHYDPGVNPHNGNKVAKAKAITLLHQTQEDVVYTSSDIKSNGPYWWSTPDLMNNGDPKGAQIFSDIPNSVEWGAEKVLWPK